MGSVSACKIRGSGSPVVVHQQFTMGVISGKNFPPFQRRIKIGEVVMDGAAIYRRKAEIGLLL